MADNKNNNNRWMHQPPYQSEFACILNNNETSNSNSNSSKNNSSKTKSNKNSDNNTAAKNRKPAAGAAPPSQRSSSASSSSSSASNNNSNNSIHNASCYCGRVRYAVLGNPLSAKICHCRGCQQLHGAPMEWMSIFHKDHVRFEPASLSYLYFYSSDTDQAWDSTNAADRVLPVKVSCTHCRTPMADEGRNMWLAYSTQFGFTQESGIPDAFRHSAHLFYGQRCLNMTDDQPKWQGHLKISPLWKETTVAKKSSFEK